MKGSEWKDSSGGIRASGSKQRNPSERSDMSGWAPNEKIRMEGSVWMDPS